MNRIKPASALYDAITGAWVGMLDANGKEQLTGGLPASGIRNRRSVMPTSLESPTITLTAASVSGITNAVNIPFTDARITWGQNGPLTTGNSGYPYGYGSDPNSFYFMTDAADFEIDVTALNVPSKVALLSEGAPIGSVTLTTASTRYMIRCTFASAKPRLIRVIGAGYSLISTFNGINTAPTSTIWNLAAQSIPPRWVFIGDSMLLGYTQVSAILGAQGFGNVAAEILGLIDYRLPGITGAGYLAGTALRGRLALSVIAPNPKYIVIALGYNDNSNTVATVLAEAQYCWNAIRAALPNATIFVMGVLNARTVLGLSTAIAAAVASMPGFVYVPAETWVTGTGNQGATTGVGNGDLVTLADAIHPTAYGSDYFGYRLAEFLRQYFDSIGAT